jgi:hypothetical protein
MNNVLFVVDKKNSALYTAALERAKSIGGQVIVANDFANPTQLLKKLVNFEPAIILFCWRRALMDCINLKFSRKIYEQIDSKHVIVFLVPDHLGTEGAFTKEELEIIKASDYYVVTSKLLFDIYAKSFDKNPPLKVFHDLPNIETIVKIKNEIRRSITTKPKVIWIGNSKWGKRQGMKDHKGLENIIRPLQSLFAEHDNCLDLEIIDSEKKFIPHKEVLGKIRASDLLIQVSRSEGTGLPVLEALGLETKVLTPMIGIAGELFEYKNEFILHDLDVNLIHEKIHSLVNKDLEETMREIYERYIVNSLQEKLVFLKRSKHLPNLKSLKSRLRIRLYWIYRYFFHS